MLANTQDIGGGPTRVVREREVANGQLVGVSRNFCALGLVQDGNLKLVKHGFARK